MKTQELSEASRNEIAYVPKSSQAFFFTPLHTTGIGEPPMDLTARIGEVRARFCGLITDRDDQIHRWLLAEFFQASAL